MPTPAIKRFHFHHTERPAGQPNFHERLRDNHADLDGGRQD